jgi:hypothetical protein
MRNYPGQRHRMQIRRQETRFGRRNKGRGAAEIIEKQLAEYLQHVRLIHFSLIIACATILYLVVSSWSGGDELVADLRDYSSFLDTVRETQRDPTRLRDILPDWGKTLGLPLEQLIQSDVGKTVSLDESTKAIFRVVPPQPSLPSGDFQSLEQSRAALEDMKWIVQSIGSLNADLTDIKQWLSTADAADTSSIKITVKSWPTQGQPSLCDLEAEIVKYVYHRDPESGIETWAETPSHRKMADVEWVSEYRSLSFPPEWFSQRFPWLDAHWDKVRMLPYDRALKWANDERTQGLRSSKPNLFGIEVRGETIGYVAPISIGCLLLYLLSFLKQLDVFVAGNLNTSDLVTLQGLSPWIGTMTNRSAEIVTRTSLTLGPLLSVSLPLWRLLGLDLSWSVLGGFVALALGYHCARISAGLVPSARSDEARVSRTVLGSRVAVVFFIAFLSLLLAAIAPLFFKRLIAAHSSPTTTGWPLALAVLAYLLNIGVYLASFYALYWGVFFRNSRGASDSTRPNHDHGV